MRCWIRGQGDVAVAGHDQTRDRRKRFGGIGALLLVASIAAGSWVRSYAFGGDPTPPSSSAIELSARRVRYWDDGEGTRWVILEELAAAIQEGDGLRANSMVAKIRHVQFNGQDGFAVDVYAEGQAKTTHPDSKPIAKRKLSFTTTNDVPQTAFTEGGLKKLDGPPKGLAILDRGFPNALPAPKAAAQRVADAPATTPVPSQTVPPIAEPAPSSTPEPQKQQPTPAPIVEVPPLPPGKPEEKASDTGPVATLGAPIEAPADIPAPPITKPTSLAKVDPGVERTQGPGDGIMGGPPILDDEEIPDDNPVPIDRPPVSPQPGDPMGAPLGDDLPAPLPPGAGAPTGPLIFSPLQSDTRRTFSVSGGPNFDQKIIEAENGDITIVLKGGINVVANLPRKVDPPKPGVVASLPYTSVDLTSDNMVIFSKRAKDGANAGGEGIAGVSQDPKEPLQIYLEGHVRIRQDKRNVAGKADETVFEAESAFYDLRTERLVALNGRVFTSTPTLLSPLKTTGRRIDQYKPIQGVEKDGDYLLGPSLIRVDQSSSTGSRFPYPGYRFNSSNIDITDITDRDDDAPNAPANQKKLQLFEAYNNIYYMGPIPVFYSPFTSFQSDFNPLLRNIRFSTGNIFGQTIQLDFNAFRLLGIKKPPVVDVWNIDIAYLSYRGPAIGSSFAYFGKDIWGDILDPYHTQKLGRDVNQPYYGYIDSYLIHDTGRDVLGAGPAIVTYGPPGAGKIGYQRISLPTFRDTRGRFLYRHMQSLLAADADPDEDFRVQLEVGYLSDRYFQEQYYNYQYQAGLDQETLVYGIKQRENRTITIQTEANLQNWNTETEWLPKIEYTRIGDGWFDGRINTSYRSGIDYANINTAVEVNNPNIFTFLPYDPVSNTSGPVRSGRAYSAGEVDVPLDFEFFKLVPYVQGQVVSWDNQLGGQQVNRVWGGVGLRANVFAWRTFSGEMLESELLNVHGLAHKINLTVDARDAYSNVNLNKLAIQDDLDDNAYEYTRRYFALTNYVGGLLPPQYDPRLLTLRRLGSPITNTTDVQGSIESVQFSLKQRLQTKRGPEGKRRIIDYMTLDLNSTYFPNARRDNFGKPFGQNTYNYEWFIGDRTSIVSYGWFEFWNVTGTPIVGANPVRANDPFGLTVITAGVNISRPPRGSVYMGYSIVNTGPIATSALNLSTTYWLSPKWFAYAALSYDFGNQKNLGNTFSVTKITKDYLISAGLTVQPLLNNNYQFAFELSPRFSPNMRFGSTVGQRFDARFAPNE